MKVTIEDIQRAEEIIRPHIRRTPLEKFDSGSEFAGFPVYLKYENLQKTGSFKIRGATNRLTALTPAERKRGIIACSAGNHAQGVACVAHRLGIKATIVMPEQSALIKIVSTKRFGAEIILKGATLDDSYLHALELQKEHGYILVHPFEDELIIAGQGTLGLELVRDLPDVDTVFMPIGGGGFLSGNAIALKAHNPKIRIIGVQAEGFDNMVKSYRTGKLIQDPPVGSTIADGIALKKPSKVIFEKFISKLVDDVMTVTDDELARTIVFLMERGKTLVEGAGAAALAALFSGRAGGKPKKAIATLSGGNIDLNTVGRVIDRGFQVVGRLVKIAVTVPDVPGSVNKLTKLIADKRANVLEIYHDRVSDRIGLRETMIEFTLETTGPDQVEEIREGFKNLGAKLLN